MLLNFFWINVLMGRTIGVRIETFVSGGRYQHKVTDIGVSPKRVSDALPSGVVDALKKAVEDAYEAMPNGSDRLVAQIRYRTR